ncbi:hypothetical protein GCM10023149_25000 [Mucilaginibacter gynuensis]|uniref:AB hydrolase-1 domain-containing protein n=1 Tax=Mucilaginibacter gynuensis TaxID=1302236 RepID=A0ABP8GGP9_9SPHI
MINDSGCPAYARIQKRTVNRDAVLSQETGLAEVTAVLGWVQPYPEALNDLKKVNQPVFIAQGENDISIQIINAANISKSLPNATLVVYPDAGHSSFFQNH